MGKHRHNSNARKIVKTNVDNSITNEIKLDFAPVEYGISDPSNLLVLPSKKRHSKIIQEKKEKTRILSKAQRKRLEKVLDKKKKKQNRAFLLESLSKVQASPDEFKCMTGISAAQTLGVRSIHDLNAILPVSDGNETTSHKKFSSIAGAKKRLRLLKLNKSEESKKKKYDPNVVDLDNSSSNNSSSDSEEESVDKPATALITKETVDLTNTEEFKLNKTNDKLKVENEVSVISCTDNIKNIDSNSVGEKCLDNGSKDDQCVTLTWQHSKSNEAKSSVKPHLQHCTKNVTVTRDPKVQIARLKLPILSEEQKIMELINENEILIVAGETGSGKTTQIPQFLYEAGYAEKGIIGITEPRRVAAVAMAARVGYEIGLRDKEVSYLMRFEGNVTKDTKIKFMTDGVLLKELQGDFLLSKYSVIIIDEAHERSVYTDILLGLLSRIVPLRLRRGNPLRLIVMSATLTVEDFTENPRLFKIPPSIIKIESRQYPVTVHFNKKTYDDYIKEAYRKTVKIHTRLPEGGILIFVTGQQEVHYLVKKLRAAFPYKKDMDYSKLIPNTRKSNAEVDPSLDSEPDDIEPDDDEVEREMKRARKARLKAKKRVKCLPKINLDDYSMPQDDGQADLLEENDSDGHLSDSEDEDYSITPEIRSCRQPLWVLPLYSMLNSKEQAAVFTPPPAGCRLCVVSTDVAETSLTIPTIKYVVDTGKKKTRVYDHATGASAWRVVWTAKASAAQRAGRAGRTCAGHAYRLYSAAVYQHDCPERHPPDITRRPVDDLVLNMKCMGIDKVVNFPFPTSPDRLQLKLSEKRLEVLGILEVYNSPKRKNFRRKDEEEILRVTALGKAVSAFPLLPRYGKMLALSHQHNLLPYTIALVSTLSVPEVVTGKADSWPATSHTLLLGDPGVLLRVVGAAEYAHANGEEELFCAKYGVRDKAIKEIRKLRKQLTSEINLSVPNANAVVDPEMKPPSDEQARLLRQLVLSGLGDQVGRKIGLHEVKEGEDKRKYKYAYHCGELDEPVHLHSGSILKKTIPDWVVYQELYETGCEERKKMVMRNVTAIEPEWLPVFVPQLCTLGEPLKDPPPRLDETTGRVCCHFKGTFGKTGWELPVVEIEFPETMDMYRWFAKFLLEGKVFQKLSKYTPSLLSPPSTMVKSWAKLHPRTETFLKTLVSHRAGSRDSLKEIWQKEPNYLRDEYLKWLPESAHNEAALYWPPL